MEPPFTPRAGAVELFQDVAQQVASLLERALGHEQHAGIERQLRVFLGDVAQRGNPVQQVPIDEFQLADHVATQPSLVFRLGLFARPFVHVHEVFQLEGQVVLGLVQVGVHLEPVFEEARHHVVAGVAHHDALVAGEHRLVGYGGLALFGEHAGGQENARVLAGQLRATVGRGEREVAAHEAVALVEAGVARVVGVLGSGQLGDGLVVQLLEEYLREKPVGGSTLGEEVEELGVGEHEDLL